MKSPFLIKSIFSLSFLLAMGTSLADQACPNIHTKSTAMICIENHSDKDVVLFQFPNDFSVWAVGAHQRAEINSATQAVEQVQLVGNEQQHLFDGALAQCSTEFVGNPAKPEFKLVRGCINNKS